jgi:ATP-GRASP peptide maturase of grasp-with-spasm system
MIFIFSKSKDYSTKIVLEWLIALQKEFMVFYEADKIKIKKISFQENNFNATLEFKDQTIQSRDLKSIWFRKEAGRVEDFFQFNFDDVYNSTVEEGLKRTISAMSNSKQEILDYIFDNVSNLKLGNNFQGRINKIKVLSEAKKVGLLIPKTIVTTEKKDVLAFYDIVNKKMITKSLDINFLAMEKIHNTVYSFVQYTNIVKDDFLDNLPNEFPLTLFQQKVEKRYEIRVMYLNGEFFSQAYFTQSLSSTNVDSRKYDDTKRTPTVPFNLPLALKKKITELMNNLKLTTASLDLIKSQNDKFIFLEVNPQGQFGYLSHSSNFLIEKRIAEIL